MTMEASSIMRRYIKAQASQPDSAFVGDLWFDTDNNNLYQYNGSTWEQINVTTDLSGLEREQLIQNIDILTALAASSLAPSDYHTMFMDIFSDSSGYSNTIDTGNTDATFSTNLYQSVGTNDGGTIGTETSTLATSGQNTIKGWGFKVYASGYTLVSVRKDANCTSTQVALTDTADRSHVIDTATFSGNTATFSSPVPLTANKEYWVVSTSESINHSRTPSTIASFPSDLTGGSATTYRCTSNNNDGFAGTSSGNLYLYNYDLLTIGGTASASTKYVQTNAITLDDNITAFQVYAKNSLTTNATIQYALSFDDGSTWTDYKELDTKYTNSTAGTSIKIKFKLATTDATSSKYSKQYNYALMVWY